MKLLLIAVAYCLFAALPGGGLIAQSIVRHEGAKDPASEGWTKFRSFAGVNTSPVKNEFGVGINAWSVNDTGGQDGIYGLTFNKQTAQRMKTSAWKLTVRLRVVDGPDEITNGAIMAGVANSGRSYIMGFGRTKAGFPIVELGRRGVSTRLVLDDLDSGYHLYELVYDPVDKFASLFVDGGLRAQNYGGLDEALQNVGDVYFGSTTSDDKGGANYATVKFELIRRQ